MDEDSRQQPGTDTAEPPFLYEPLERFGEGLTTSRPWNRSALAGVERLNGRVAMIGFLAALIGEELTGRGIVGQLALMLRWLLG
ncbi:MULTISPECIES: chlorophyll a/b-binding protein [Cyanophyceae]|uniref:High light inducible protein n=1 Tax=Aphanothece cf. minutissima CCALA 015 TaxID=2107695 RepID=A0ABX5F4H5_9CHRO|nr:MULTISPECIES: chlorophyll a/b-binding protein [Cyanophyceae]MCP9796300.1 high light inducible protein [Cyanobium sp. Lug-B]PSB36101.1 high light inducible protein [Aphanothece cf. minutissima CCALA 015]